LKFFYQLEGYAWNKYVNPFKLSEGYVNNANQDFDFLIIFPKVSTADVAGVRRGSLPLLATLLIII